MNEKEKSVLEEIKNDLKEIKDILKNPKGLLEGEKFKRFDPNEPITEGQKWKLNTLGLEISEGLTKGEASIMISEALKQKTNKQEYSKDEPPDY